MKFSQVLAGALGLIAATLAAQAALAASSKSDWSYEDCPERAQARWCAPMMKSGGWQLKYRSTQPEDMPEVYWLIEVWVKGPDALVCELKGGRGGVRSNGCYSAVEVK